MKCQRCGSVSTVSFFNTEEICMECQRAEQQHPRYAEARAEETAACLRGDFNYPGIGCPPELRKQ